jgi:hypothetical protein
MTHPVLSFLEHHASAVVAGGASAIGTAAYAAGQVPVPAEVPSWLPMLVTVVGPALVWTATRVTRGVAARQRALAEAKDRRAALIRADGDPTNDAEAARLEDEADAARALAAGLEAAQGPRQ